MNNKKISYSDKFNVEATSINDLDGCATTEATGLIPAMPKSISEIDSYKEILPYSPDCYVEKTSEKRGCRFND